MAKRKKYSRACWDVMEFVTSMIKPKMDKDGNYHFKKGFRKKDIKKIKRICPHWVIDEKKNTAMTALKLLYDDNGIPTGEVECRICHERFPLHPGTNPGEYEEAGYVLNGLVNQIEYWDIDSGGSSENMAMFDALRKYIPRFVKVAKRVSKAYESKDKLSKTVEAAKRGNAFAFHGGGWIET